MISRYVASLFILTSCRSGFGWSSLCSGGPMVGGWPCLLGHKVRVRCTRLIMGPSRSSKHFASCSIGAQHAAWWWEANDTCSGASPISLYVLTGTWSALCCDSLWLASGIDPVWHLVDWRTRPAYQRLINVSMLRRCAVVVKTLYYCVNCAWKWGTDLDMHLTLRCMSRPASLPVGSPWQNDLSCALDVGRELSKLHSLNELKLTACSVLVDSSMCYQLSWINCIDSCLNNWTSSVMILYYKFQTK